MKANKSARVRIGLILGIALLLIAAGMGMIFRTFREYAQILAPLRPAVIRLTMAGGLVTAGVGTLVILLVHLASRGHREIKALQRKNQAMEALNRSQEQLAHRQRLEMIGTMTSSIAHEFNNLLSPIMGYSLMALEKLPPEDEELYDGIVEIYNSSRKAKTIISRLSDLSRKNTDASFHPVAPDDLIRKNLEVLAPVKPENVELRLSLNCWDQRLKANEIQLSQLLLNLLLNAFHAMEPQGGILTVDTWFDEDSIHIRVTDTGCGIPEDVLPHIFDPFFTTKEAGKGTGLGLAIVAQVVEDHKGSIQVNSNVGKGTSFTISLPRDFQPLRK